MSETGTDGTLKAYLQESKAWDQDRLAALRTAARRAWQVAATAGACALVAGLALVLLLPLKRTEPFVIRVDSSTGVVDVVPVYTGQLQAAQSVTRYFLTHYVMVCQRFNLSTAESDYEECGAFHTARTNQSWAALWSRSNPLSPLNLHRDGSEVSVQIESVSFIQRVSGIDDLAQVRYLKIEQSMDGQPQRVTHWIATIQYAYAAASSDPGVRRWNPLGFKIVSFVAEPEVIRDPPAQTPEGSRAGNVPPAAPVKGLETP
ncbi:MAG TPA: type IV secretion system protein [Steroidobacteraceae bacterium]|nr:type IV secretion system protein [Steroidobacteraceae bacterium]